MTEDEIISVGARAFWVVAGTPEDYLVTHWELVGYREGIYVGPSYRVEGGIKVSEFNDSVSSGLGGYDDIDEIIQLCIEFTKLAYIKGVLNDVPFYDLEGYSDGDIIPTDMKTEVFYPILNVYRVYVNRCRKVHLDENKYAIKLILEYYNRAKDVITGLTFAENLIEARKYL